MLHLRLLLILLLYTLGGSLHAQKERITLVLDPGHGGKDPGHLSHNSTHKTEKELNLDITLLVGSYIEKYLQNIDIIYTRTDDSFPTLDDRVTLANSKNADLFVSIHCNGNDKKSIHGTESHVHNLDAKKSYTFAKEIEKQFSERAGRHSRGIKNGDDRSHSIQVLKYTRMTSVLIECGFLTNKKEANFLNSQYGQEIIASAIFRAIRSYLQTEYPKINFVPAKEVPKGNYTIQLMSSKNAIDTKSTSFDKLNGEVKRKELDTKNPYKYIYTFGSYSSQEEAKKALAEVQSSGFKDAFPVKVN